MPQEQFITISHGTHGTTAVTRHSKETRAGHGGGHDLT
jgi:hypothetical protein